MPRKKKPNKMAVHYSSQKQDWGTPVHLFAALDKKYGPFKLDAAASPLNAKVSNYFTEAQDALKLDWAPYGKVWLNPPYKGISKWIEKCVEESKKGAFIVVLMPARTDTRYFHDHIYNKKYVDVVFLKGRIRFAGAPASAPFPSMLAIFKPRPTGKKKVSG
jgi:phage N-6-adenine-methyltransferase